MESPKDKDAKNMKVAWSITERNGRSYWNRVGVAFTNRDGSITVNLDAMPVSGKLQIREYEPPRDDVASVNGRTNGNGAKKDGPLVELPF